MSLSYRIFTVLFLVSFATVTFGGTCSTPSKKALLDYIQKTATTISSSNPQYATYETSRRLSAFKEIFTNCNTQIRLHGLEQCFSNLNNYSGRKDAIEKSKFAGFEMSRKDYFQSRSKKAFKLPKELKNGLPKNYRSIAKRKKWKVVEYRSRTVSNPSAHDEQSRKRVLILVEDSPYDKYIQFTMPISEQGQPQQLVDFISVDKTQTPNEISFNQFWRNKNGEKPRQRKNFDSCFSCHPNGMRNVSPAPGSVAKQDTKSLDYLNDKMNSYGKLDWGGAVNPEHDGPSLGDRQGCTRCHNGYSGTPELSRGALTLSTSRGHIRHKMHGDGSMPVSSSKKEQEVLDYFKYIQEKLTEKERLELEKYLYVENSDPSTTFETYKRILKYMKKINKMDEEKFKDYNAVLTGNSKYPACVGEKGCYEGLEVRADNESTLLDSGEIQEAMKNWFLKDCAFESDDSGVNDSQRSTPTETNENVQESSNGIEAQYE